MKNPVKILVTFALDAEFSPWRKQRAFTRVQSVAAETYQTGIAGVDVRVALTGVGAQNAARAAGAALHWQPDVCISAGLAGGLRESCRRADVFAAREVRDLESGRTLFAQKRLLAHAANLGIAPLERLLSSSEMIVSCEAKRRLSAMAAAVDMESFAVLWEAEARGVAGIAIRAVSDAWDENLPLDFSMMLDGEGKISSGKAARALAGAPHKLPSVLRLSLHSRRAAKNLAQTLDAFLTRPASAEIPFTPAEALRA